GISRPPNTRPATTLNTSPNRWLESARRASTQPGALQPDRRPMEGDRLLHPDTGLVPRPRGPTRGLLPPRDARRDALPGRQRHQMAGAAGGLPALEGRPPVLHPLARARRHRCPARSAPPTMPAGRGTRPGADRGDYRLSVVTGGRD